MNDRPPGLTITEEDWQNTPPAVRAVVNYLIKRIEELEARINRDSSNCNQPPSPTRRSSFRKSTWKIATSSFTRSSVCTA